MADQIYKVQDPQGNIREISGPAGASDAEVIAQAQELFAPKSTEKLSPIMEVAKRAGVSHNAAEGVLMGIKDPINAGAQYLSRLVPESVNQALDMPSLRQSTNPLVSALANKVLANPRPEAIDQAIREQERAYQQKRATSGESGFDASRLVGNVLPTMATGMAQLPLAAVSTIPRMLGTTAALGGLSSQLTPVTSQEEQANFPETKRNQAVMGTVLGPLGTIIGKGFGAVGGNIAQRVSESSASDAAKLKLAELLSKSGVGTMFRPGGGGDPLAQIEAKLATRAPETTLAGVAGQGPKSMLDTLATLPGEAKTLVEQLIRNQQATRGKRLVTAADEALGTSGKTYTGTLDALVNEKKTVSAPFYEQLKGVSVKVDNDLSNLIQASKTAHGGAELLAEIKRTTPIDISKIKTGDDISFDALDKVKQALYDLAEKSKGEFGKATELSKAYNQLRIDLTNKMDALSPKDKNGSIYKQARDAFAGPSQLEDAVKTGRNAMKEDAIKVADATKGMGASEIEAYRIGVLQSLKDKVGTEGGQTSLLKMWKEPATSDKLKEIFGNDYRKFAADVAREARLKEIETVGRGSQTAQRIFGAGELDNLAPVAQAVQGAASGNPVQTMGAMAKMWNRVSTPEETRNELAKLLLQQGPAAVRTVRELPAMVKQYNEAELKKALLASTLAQQPNR